MANLPKHEDLYSDDGTMRKRWVGRVAFQSNDTKEIIPLPYACMVLHAGRYWWLRLIVLDDAGTKGQWELHDEAQVRGWLSDGHDM